MRAALLLLLAILAALVPAAAAQPLPPQGSVVIQVTPPSDPVRPLQGAVTLPVKVTFSCDATYAGSALYATLHVTRQPAWATVVVAPATAGADGTTCADAHEVVFPGTVSISASDQAPAFVPDSIELSAQVYDSVHEPSQGRASFPVAADYFSILDASAARSQAALPPGGITILPVKLTNFGNGATKVLFEVATDAADLVAPTPPPLILQSKQEGGSVVSAEIPFEVRRQSDSVATGTEKVTLRWAGSYAWDPKLRGDSGSLTFIVTPHGEDAPTPSQEDLQSLEHRVPGPALGLVALGVAGAALLVRRRAR